MLLLLPVLLLPVLLPLLLLPVLLPVLLLPVLLQPLCMQDQERRGPKQRRLQLLHTSMLMSMCLSACTTTLALKSQQPFMRITSSDVLAGNQSAVWDAVWTGAAYSSCYVLAASAYIFGAAPRLGLPSPSSPGGKTWIVCIAFMGGFSFHAERQLLGNTHRMEGAMGMPNLDENPMDELFTGSSSSSGNRNSRKP